MTPENDDGLPWLNWAMTGILTLAGVVVTGLIISARYPRLPSMPGHILAAVAPKTSVRTQDSAAPAGADSSALSAHGEAHPGLSRTTKAEDTKEMLPRVAVARPAMQAPPENKAASETSAPVEPLPPTVRPAGRPPTAAVLTPPESAAVKTTPSSTDAAKRAAFVRKVAEIRLSMSQRDLAASKQKLQTAASHAQTPADQAELERLEILQDHLEQYWAGIGKAVAAMQPVDEIVLSESNRVAVIEANRTELSVQWEGRPQRFRIKAIPRELLWAITKTSFKPTAGSKLVVGAFLAMDAFGDRTQAGRLWRDAIKSGEDEGKLLLPELDLPRAGQ